MPINLIFGLPVDNLKYLDFCLHISGWGRFVSFSFRFQELDGTGVSFRAYASVRFAEMIGSFPFRFTDGL